MPSTVIYTLSLHDALPICSGRAAQTACMTGLNTACRRTAAGAAVALPPDNQPRILGRRSLLFATSHAALSLLLSAFLLPAAFRACNPASLCRLLPWTGPGHG